MLYQLTEQKKKAKKKVENDHEIYYIQCSSVVAQTECDYAPSLPWDIPNRTVQSCASQTELSIWDISCPKHDHVPSLTWDIPG